MQTVWSRVAQAGASCRCASCTVKTSVTRHAGTAASKRPTRYFTTSTLLYSGIFAVAATTDALVKEKRRQQWDQAIEGAKAGVEQAHGRLEKLQESVNGLHLGGQSGAEELFNDSECLFEDSRQIHGGRSWPQSNGNPFLQGNFAPQSIWASDCYELGGRQRHWTPKKLRLTELAVDELTIRTFLSIPHAVLHNESLNEVYTEDFKRLMRQPRSSLKILANQLRQSFRSTKSLGSHAEVAEFAANPGALAQYTHDINARHVEEADLDEQVINRNFERLRQGELTWTQMVLRNLHQMATSNAPPSLKTWNRLLHGCNEQCATGLMYQVIRAMRISYVRMNEYSLVEILEHYKRKDDYAGFRRWVEIMQGMHGGLHLARPGIWTTTTSQGRLVSLETESERKIAQRPVANPMVLSTLIKGVLHFEGFNAAITTLTSMAKDGWGLSMKGLTPLLRDCAKRTDWDAGVNIWKQIRQLHRLSERGGKREAIHPESYAALLQLCVACDMHTECEAVISEAVKTTNITRASLINMVKRLNVASHQELTSRALQEQERIRWRPAEEVASALMGAEDLSEVQLEAGDEQSMSIKDESMLLENPIPDEASNKPNRQPHRVNTSTDCEGITTAIRRRIHAREMDEPSKHVSSGLLHFFRPVEAESAHATVGI